MLANAAQQLESTNLATTISPTVGMPIEQALSALLGHWASIVSKMAQAHFSIRLLARKYGAKKVEELYKKLSNYN